MSLRISLIPPTLFNILLAVAAGGLLALGWPPATWFYLVLFAWVPLLLLSDRLGTNARSLFAYALLVTLALFIWNAYTTQWIYRTFFTSGVVVNFLNVTLFALPWVIYHALQNRWSKLHRYALLVSSWMSVEMLHYYWGLSFPYLTLGNVLASVPPLAQWYEYTGVFGGSLWVWGANLLLYEVLKELLARRRFGRLLTQRIGYALLWILLPMGISLAIFSSYEERGEPVEVVAVHTDLDCRKERKVYTAEQMVKVHWELTQPYLNSHTRYILWPEGAVNVGWLEELSTHTQVQDLRNKLRNYPDTQLITGAVIHEQYQPADTARIPANVDYIKVAQQKVWYNTYNGALQLNATSGAKLRTKIHMTPLEETTVYPLLVNFLRKFIPSLGGFHFSTWSGNQNVFHNQTDVTPVICYESFFGHTVKDFVYQGADLLFVILNEGWMDDDQQAQQFMQYASLRAIENRRDIVRSSNKGITCFMDQKGMIEQAISDNTSTVLIAEARVNKKKTFYTMTGDYIGWIAVVAFTVYSVTLLIAFIRYVLTYNYNAKQVLLKRAA